MIELNLKKEYLQNEFPRPRGKAAAAVGKVAKASLSQYIIFALVLSCFQWALSKGLLTSSFIFAIGNTMIYAIIAVGFCLLLGYSGLASLGTAGFIGIGTYAAYYVMQVYGIGIFWAFAATVVVSVIIGVLVGFISLRIEGIYLAILTLGLSEILRNLFISLKATIKLDVSNVRIFGAQMGETAVFFIILAVFVLLLWITSNLIHSPVGRALISIKNSSSAAQAMGISLMKYRLLAFVISTVYAAVAGLMYMLYIRNMTTSSSTLLTMGTSLNILGAVIIGGAKSLWGTTFGVFIIYGLQSMFLSKIPFFVENPAFITMITGLLIILIVMFFPGGVAQMVGNARAAIKKKRLQRRFERYGDI
ncbi:MAG: branched-chain amino acid ABC transporter permease [Oscillospiraceae bacterium]